MLLGAKCKPNLEVDYSTLRFLRTFFRYGLSLGLCEEYTFLIIFFTSSTDFWIRPYEAEFEVLKIDILLHNRFIVKVVNAAGVYRYLEMENYLLRRINRFDSNALSESRASVAGRWVHNSPFTVAVNMFIPSQTPLNIA